MAQRKCQQKRQLILTKQASRYQKAKKENLQGRTINMSETVLDQNVTKDEADVITLPSDKPNGDGGNIDTPPAAAVGEPDENNDKGQADSAEEQKQEQAGRLDIAAFEKEFTDNGSLSDKSYEALAKVGITKEIVDRYIEGRAAYSANYDEQVMSVAGGQEEYKRMAEWASENLSDSEKESYNRAVLSKDVELAKLATAGLMSKYKSSQGSPVSKAIEGGAGAASSYYSSMNELVADQKDARYDIDPRYRQAVDEKLRRSIAAGKI